MKMRKAFAVFLIILLALPVVFAQEDTKAIRDLNERLERNKAEILKEIKNSQEQTKNQMSIAIDDNFKVLDERMSGLYKGQTRDIAVVMVAGFIGAFVISQIIKLQVEKLQRRGLVKSKFELETKVHTLAQQHLILRQEIAGLEQSEKEIAKKMEKYRGQVKPQRFLRGRTIAFGVLTFVAGAVSVYLVTRVV